MTGLDDYRAVRGPFAAPKKSRALREKQAVRRSEQGQEALAAQAGLFQDGQNGSAGDVFALRHDHEANASGRVLAAEGTVAALAPMRRLDETGPTQGRDDLPG